MPVNRWQQLYSHIFVLAVLISLLLTMVKSLQGGLTEFDDAFFGKPRLISTFNYLRYSMGDKVFPQVLVGKEGWLEFTSNNNLDDYQNASINPEQLKSIHQKLEILNQELAERNITLILAVAPNKATIYPDKVSEKLEKIHEQSRLDTFLELIEQDKFSYVIDLRPALMEARNDDQLYYRTDTHWNSIGSYIAYREIMNIASEAYPELQPYNLDQFRWKESTLVLDLPKLMGADFIKESWNVLEPMFDTSYRQKFPIQSEAYISWGYNDQEKTLLMYHDSFGVALQYFLQHHFEDALYVHNADPEPSETSWIDITKPDLVIIEIVERNLLYLDVLLSKMLEGLARNS